MFGGNYFAESFFAEGYAGPVQTAQAISATQTQTPTIARVNTFHVTLTATQTQTASATLLASHARVLTVTDTQTPTVTEAAAHLRTLTATETQTGWITEPTTKQQALTGAAAQTPSVTHVAADHEQLSATQAQSGTIDHTYIPAGGTTTDQAVTATAIQAATIDATLQVAPTQGGGEPAFSRRPRRRVVPPKQTSRYLKAMSVQTASLDATCLPGERTLRRRSDDEALRLLIGDPLSPDDDELFLLLI